MIRTLVLAMAAGLGALPLAAQATDDWTALVAEADSIGPETPGGRIAPDRLCPAGLLSADSIEVAGPGREFLSFARSMRTRGMWTGASLPQTGSGRFALRQMRCDPKSGRPLTFVMERDQRYLYLVANLREHPTFEELRFRSAGVWSRYRWIPASREFVSVGGDASGSSN